MRTKTKYRIHESYRTQTKAQKALEVLRERNPNTHYEIHIRSFPNKDKRRFYIRSIVRPGTK